MNITAKKIGDGEYEVKIGGYVLDWTITGDRGHYMLKTPMGSTGPHKTLKSAANQAMRIHRQLIKAKRQMDPNRTLWDLMWAIYEGDAEEAIELTDALRAWISKGGLLPGNITQLPHCIHPDKPTFTIIKG